MIFPVSVLLRVQYWFAALLLYRHYAAAVLCMTEKSAG